MVTKLLIIDVETTGVLYYRHAIHQLSAMVVIDDQVIERFNVHIRPHELAEIDETALKAGGVTREQIMAYPHRDEQHPKFKALLDRYIDPYNTRDRFFLLGYNNSWFDDAFLRNFLILQNDDSFNAYFWPNTIDVMILATQYLLPVRHLLPTFRLSRVAKYLGIEVKDEALHQADYDLGLTWEIYKKVRGKTIDDW